MHPRVRSTCLVAVQSLLLCTAQFAQAEPDAPIQVSSGDWAQSVSPDARERASDLVRCGNEAFYDKAAPGAAIRLYREALEHWDHPGIHLNLAIVYLYMDRKLEAFDSLEQALRHGAAPFEPREYQRALVYQRQLRQDIAEIDISGADKATVITVDGTRLRAGTTSVRVLAGEHQIVAAKPDHASAMRTVTVRGGDQMRVDLDLVPLPPPARMTRRWAQWKSWTVLGLGLSTGAAGVALHWRANANMQQYRDARRGACLPFGCEPDEVPAHLIDLERRALTQERLAIAADIVGGLATVAGLAMLYANRPIVVHPRESRSRITISSITQGPADSLGIGLVGHF